MSHVRTRFAPSPTGSLHVGNARVAIFNWLFARHHDGSFIVRMEDTDVERNVAGAEAAILHDLRWLGLHWDEGPEVGGDAGPYRQSERLGRYRKRARALEEDGRAYPCFCDVDEPGSPDDVSGDAAGRTEPGCPCVELSAEERRARSAAGRHPALRFTVPRREVEVIDEIRGSITFDTNDFGDFIILRSDGRPTYNFAVVVDDAAMEITHVIRGAGHLSNTPKQRLLYEALDERPPSFAHLPTVLGPDRSKLSKRTGARPLAEYRAEGFPPDALLNYLSLLGWSHPEEEEFLSPRELVEVVDLDRVGAADTVFDPEKLRWLSGRHIRAMEAGELARAIRSHLDADRFPIGEERLPAVAAALRERLETFGEVNDVLASFFPGEDALAGARGELAQSEESREVLASVREALADLPGWTAEAADAAVREGGEAAGARGGRLFKPVRKALTGEERGPDLGSILAVLGPEEALRRIDAVLRKETV